MEVNPRQKHLRRFCRQKIRLEVFVFDRLPYRKAYTELENFCFVTIGYTTNTILCKSHVNSWQILGCFCSTSLQYVVSHCNHYHKEVLQRQNVHAKPFDSDSPTYGIDGNIFECCFFVSNHSPRYPMHGSPHFIYVRQRFWQHVGAFAVLHTIQRWLLESLVVIFHIVRIMLALTVTTSANQ